MIRIKICCISSADEARLAIRHGANALGLVSEMPSGPGVISENEIRSIAPVISPSVTSVLLTSKKSVAEIIRQQNFCRVNAIQLVEKIDPSELSKLREQLPGISLFQVIHVIDNGSIDEAKSVQNLVDAVLLDSGNPFGSVKELGGTGRTHNWEISRTIRDSLNLPVFLAGGLNPENIVEAVQTVKPFGVDVCSGIRSSGRLDETKLLAFVQKLRPAGTYL